MGQTPALVDQLQCFQYFGSTTPYHLCGGNIGEFIGTGVRGINLSWQTLNRRGTSMKAYWVIDILKDIRQFSEKNGMVVLAEQLDDAIFVAASEIGMKLSGSGTVGGGTGIPRGATGTTADHEVH
jgi:hypothetical protein